MRKCLKITGVSAAIVIFLFIAAIITATQLIDLNDYKKQITHAVYQHTGRILTITGHIDWSFFPSLGIKIGAMSLNNAKGFTKQPFAEVQEADVSIRLWPLLSGHIAFGNIFLKGLQLNLTKNRQGKTNWQDLILQQRATTTIIHKPVEKESQHTTALNLSIANIHVDRGKVAWHNQQTNKSWQIHNIEVEGKQIAFGKQFPLQFSATIRNNENFDVKLAVKGRFWLKENLSAFAIKQFSAAVNQAKLTGTLTAKNLDKKLVIDGAFNLQPFNLRQLLSKLGDAAPNLSDKTALQHVAGFIKFTASNHSLNMSQLTLSLDQSHFQGNFTLNNFSKPIIRFAVQVDQLNIDRYLPTSTPNTPSNNPLTTTKTSRNTASPWQALRTLNLNGTLHIGTCTIANLTTRDAKITVQAKNGLLQLSPITAKLYQGNAKATLLVNVRGNIPKLTIKAHLQQIQLQPLLIDLSDMNNIAGIANLKMDLTAQGDNPARILKTLTGNSRFKVAKGKLVGTNFSQFIEIAQ
ncbi:MAG: AsmA family protein, partial [Gammaproteobacteria bacterium]|nr:AsmA family protein [Gammaproteobacteria bacterium]